MKRSCFSLFLALVCVAAAGAQESTAFARFPDALGAHIMIDALNGDALGGLSYQHWFGAIGLQATAGGSLTSNGEYRYSAVGSLQYLLFGADFSDWFSGGLYGNVLLAHSARGNEGGSYDPKAHLGLGVGIETVILGHIAPSFEFMYIASLPFTVGFGFGASIRYRF